MSFITRSLSEHDRRHICLILLCLNILQIFVAIACFALGAYISLRINSKAHLVKNYNLKSIGGSLSGFSIALFFLHCFGAKVSNDCSYLITRQRFENKLVLIVLGYVVMSVCLLIVPLICLVQLSRLKEVLGHGLISSMKLYARNKNIKRDFDDIQMDYKCCGNSNYTDWFRLLWMPKNSIPSENDRIFSRKNYLHSVPFSCCDPSFPGPCFHHLVDIERGEYRYPNHGFFKRGCTEALFEVLKEVLQATTILVLVPFFLELAIAVHTRYLQTSLDDCKSRNDPAGVGVGVLFRKRSSDEHLTSFWPSYCSLGEESILYEPKRAKVTNVPDYGLKELLKNTMGSSVEDTISDMHTSNYSSDYDVSLKPTSEQWKTNKEVRDDNKLRLELRRHTRKKEAETKVKECSIGTRSKQVKTEPISIRSSSTKGSKDILDEDLCKLLRGNETQDVSEEDDAISDNDATPLLKPVRNFGSKDISSSGTKIKGRKVESRKEVQSVKTLVSNKDGILRNKSAKTSSGSGGKVVNRTKRNKFEKV